MMQIDEQRHMVEKLRRAHAAQVIETHISWVLLIGEYAYKVKKAIDLGFLDYLQLASRKHFCEEELRLNRRTAPDLYLEVVAIGGSVEAPVLGMQPAIEYAVQMRRFGDEALMDVRLALGKVQAEHVDVLAHDVARFHAQADRVDEHVPYGDAQTIRTAAMQNFEQMRSLLTDAADVQQLDRLEQATQREWEACRELFGQRRAQGFVRECHGDMHLGNIVLLDDVPVPFDGIEFAPSLRWIDVLDEVAFTMMDLLHHGRADLAWRYLNAYLQETGDYTGVGVLRFYLAYRAAVRAKIAAIRVSQSAKPEALQACRTHLALAQRCLSERQPALVITHGLPGSGKSTFAQYVVEQLGAVRIRSDVERKRLFGLSALESSQRSGLDIYSAEATALTYDRLQMLAQDALEAGHTVIVDAAFLRRVERVRFARLARSRGLPFVIASLDADVKTLQSRIHARRYDASEADVAVLDRLQAAQQPPADDELEVALCFSTTQPPQSGRNARSWKRLSEIVGAG
jgi:aminoglycoside phosphotransferase family enzyme/gluconate kinase